MMANERAPEKPGFLRFAGVCSDRRMITLLANSGPVGWVEEIIAFSTLFVAVVFGLTGLFFGYRPASIGGGVAAVLVGVFLLISASQMDRQHVAKRVGRGIIPILVGVALIALKRSQQK
jgi:hypothetical protein